MKAAISNTQSLEDILRSYSGRRLQFAIKLGILPKPENLSRVLKRKPCTRTSIFYTSTLTNQGV